MLALDTDWAKVSFSIPAKELSVDCRAIRRELMLSPAPQQCIGCHLIHAHGICTICLWQNTTDGERQQQELLLWHCWHKWEALLLLGWSYQTLRSRKKLKSAKSTNRSNFRETRDGTGQEAKTALVGMSTWHCIFQQSISLTLLYQPLTQAKSNPWVLTRKHCKELISSTASSYIRELSLLERDAGYGDAKASPSWLCPHALGVPSAVFSHSVPKEGHFRAFCWQGPD